VKVRAKIEADGDKRVVITELPWGKTTESLMESIETAVAKG
jgi:topoisomerase-4 subunit A